MAGLSLPVSNFLPSAMSQTLAGFAGRASTALKSFDSDLDSGNVSGAQSFLSTLQQKVNAQGGAPAGSSLATQFSQVSSDLASGNLSAAKSDFASLQSGLAQLRKGAQSLGTGSQVGSSANTGSEQSALQSLNLMQQSAYNTALNLTLPSAAPSLSVSSW
jgi:hypothetical protein